VLSPDLCPFSVRHGSVLAWWFPVRAERFGESCSLGVFLGALKAGALHLHDLPEEVGFVLFLRLGSSFIPQSARFTKHPGLVQQRHAAPGGGG